MTQSVVTDLVVSGLETKVPALGAVVVDAAGRVDLAVAGVRRVGGDEPVTVHDRFHLGSNTKAFVATLAGRLVESGALGWDTRVGEVFGPTVPEILEPYRAVTLESLLKHEAGIPPYTDDDEPDFVLPGGGTAAMDVGAFARWLIGNRPPLGPVGEFSYSNAGYAVAAAMIEEAADETWATLIQHEVLDPLSIDGAVGRGWPAADDPDQPWGHVMDNGEPVPHPPDDDYQLEAFLGPAGDMSMSLPEYATFLRAHLAGVHGNDSIVSAGTFRHLHNGGEPGIGLGWGVTPLRGLESLGPFSTHAGSAGTFVVGAAVSHAHDVAVAVATNCGDESNLGTWLKAIISHQLA